MSKKKLLILTNDPLKAYDYKGYSREERATYFNPLNTFDVSIFEIPFYRSRFTKFDQEDYAGFPVIVFDESMKGVHEAAKKFNPDLIRGYGNSGNLAGELGKLLGVPSVLSVHDRFPTDAIFSTDRVICVSDEVKQRCIENGLNSENIRVLYDRVDTDLFKDYSGTEEVRKLEERFPFKIRTVSAGRLVWEKNLGNLIEATQIVKECLGDYTHIHLGNFGEEKEKLEDKIQNADHFKIIPSLPQNELARYFSLADAFVMASLSEGFGLVYIEALSCGTPVVTSDRAPMNSYVINGYNGFVVDPNSPLEIANKTLDIVANQKIKKELTKNARESIKKFDSVEQQRKEVEIYFELLNEFRKNG